MNPNIFDFMKKLILISGNGSYEGSTKSIGEKLGLSQQSVSLYLITLEKEGYIKRIRKREGQAIYFLDKLYEELKNEYDVLGFILQKEEKIRITGTVFTGMGEGRYYMSQENYKEGIRRELGFLPYPGTLNLRLSKDQLYKLDILRLKIKKFIPKFESNGREFGKVYLFNGYMKNHPVGIVMPERTHYNDVIEIVSSDRLRDLFHLVDGNEVDVTIYF